MRSATSPTRLVQVLDDRLVHHDDLVEAVERHLAVRAGPWHARVDLGEHGARRTDGGQANVDRDTETAHPALVRRARLHERHVERQAPDGDQVSDVGQRDRHVVDRGARCERAHVGSDVEGAVSKPAARGAVPIGPRAVGQEVDELHAHRRRGLERLEQPARRRARAAHEHVVPGTNRAHGLRGTDRAALPLLHASRLRLARMRVKATEPRLAPRPRQRGGRSGGQRAGSGLAFCLTRQKARPDPKP